MFFRMEVDQISHSRDVYYFMDFIGDIGGVGEVLLQICGWVFGGYGAFHAMFSTIAILYLYKGEENPFAKSKKETAPGLHKIKLPLSTRFWLYMQTTPCGCFFTSCKKDKHIKLEQIIEAGSEKVEEDFNLEFLLKQNKELRKTLEGMK